MFRKTFIVIFAVLVMLPLNVGKSYTVFASGESVTVSLNYKYTTSQKGKLAGTTAFTVPVDGFYIISGLSPDARVGLYYLGYNPSKGCFEEEQQFGWEDNVNKFTKELHEGSIVDLEKKYYYYFKNLDKDTNVTLNFKCENTELNDIAWADGDKKDVYLNEEIMFNEQSTIVEGQEKSDQTSTSKTEANPVEQFAVENVPDETGKVTQSAQPDLVSQVQPAIIDATPKKSDESGKWEWGQEIEVSQEIMDKYHNQKPARIIVLGMFLDPDYLVDGYE